MDIIFLEKLILLGILAFFTVADLRNRLIPLFGLFFAAAAGSMLYVWLHPFPFQSLIAGVCLGGLFYLFSLVTKESIGKGDALMILVSSLFLGFRQELVLVCVALSAAGIVAVMLLIRKKGKDYRIPFAPFLFLADGVLLFLN